MTRTWIVAALYSTAFACVGVSPSGGFESNDPPPEFQECASIDEVTFYEDKDQDGYGDPNGATQSGCETETIAGFVPDGSDCDDTEPLAYSSATELCGDKVDNDCSGGDPCLSSMVAHWDFSETTGGSALDHMGNGLDGILQNGLIHGAVNTLVFDGADDYVEVPGEAELFQLSTGTVSFWFKPLTVTQNQALVSKDSSGNDAGGHMTIYLDDNGTVRARLQSNQESYDISSVPLLANQWHHVAFMFGGNEGMNLYVDGVLSGQDPYTGGLNRNREPLVIGAGTDNSGDLQATPINREFAGEIAEVHIYDRQLLQDELTGVRLVTAPLGATP